MVVHVFVCFCSDYTSSSPPESEIFAFSGETKTRRLGTKVTRVSEVSILAQILRIYVYVRAFANKDVPCYLPIGSTKKSISTLSMN